MREPGLIRRIADRALAASRSTRVSAKALRFVVGLVPVPVILAFQIAFWQVIRPFGLFLFVVGVFFSSWIGGLYAGVLSTVAAAILAHYFFVPPERTWTVGEPRHLVVLAMFVGLGVMLSVLHQRFKKASLALAAALSEVRRANDEVRRLYEKAREVDTLKTHLFARVSHELRTPLTLVLGPVERMVAAAGGECAAHRDLTLVARNARTLLRYVDDLLEVSKLSACQVEPEYEATDLARLLRFAASHFELAARAKGVSYTVEAPDELWADVDPARIQRVLLNLLSNALKFTPAAGRVRATLRADVGRGRVRFEVADSGPGIPADERQLVFEAYRQRKGVTQLHGGTGLGLSIAHELVALHGGSLAIEEAPEGGALLVADLPRRAPPGTEVRPARTGASPAAREDQARAFVEEIQPPPGAPAEPSGAPGAPLVLVVEDNREMSATLCEGLRREYRVAAAFDGKEGLARTLELRPDLVITDLMMPEMSGEDLVRAIRAHPEVGETPIVVLTALADDEARVRLLRAGARDYVTKPFRVEELHARVESAIAARRAERHVRALDERLQAVSSASNVVSEALANLPRESIEGVLRTIAAQAQRLTGAAYVALGLGRDADQPFEPWVFVGVSPEEAAAIGRHPRPLGTLGAVVREGAPLRVSDLTRHPAHRGFPPGHPPMSSFLGVPVRYRDRVMGHLYLTNKRGGEEFSEEDQALVEMLAAHAGLALETARLYEHERDARAWLEAVIEQMPDAVRLFDAEGRVVMLNRAAAALGGSDDGRRDPFGNPVRLDLCSPSGDRLPPAEHPGVRALLRGEPVLAADVRIRRPDGGLLPVLASAVPIRSPDGRKLGATSVFRDVSAQKELDRLRSEWSAILVHDLRQPVGVVSLGVGVLRRVRRDALTEVEQRYLDRIDAAARTLAAMIDELLDASRLDTQHLAVSPAAIDVAALAREVCDRTANVTAGHPVSVHEAGAGRRAWADSGRIEQVIANLLSNAAKYGAPGTEIRVDLEGREDTLEVTVTNHGCGIDPEDLPRLFQRFMRSHASVASGTPGIGLGLYLCKGLIEAHGGRIWAESTPGERTRFHFTLPAVAERTIDEAEEPPVSGRRCGDGSVAAPGSRGG